jgi:hypothetical protein
VREARNQQVEAMRAGKSAAKSLARKTIRMENNKNG